MHLSTMVSSFIHWLGYVMRHPLAPAIVGAGAVALFTYALGSTARVLELYKLLYPKLLEDGTDLLRLMARMQVNLTIVKMDSAASEDLKTVKTELQEFLLSVSERAVLFNANTRQALIDFPQYGLKLLNMDRSDPKYITAHKEFQLGHEKARALIEHDLKLDKVRAVVSNSKVAQAHLNEIAKYEAMKRRHAIERATRQAEIDELRMEIIAMQTKMNAGNS